MIENKRKNYDIYLVCLFFVNSDKEYNHKEH